MPMLGATTYLWLEYKILIEKYSISIEKTEQYKSNIQVKYNIVGNTFAEDNYIDYEGKQRELRIKDGIIFIASPSSCEYCLEKLNNIISSVKKNKYFKCVVDAPNWQHYKLLSEKINIVDCSYYDSNEYLRTKLLKGISLVYPLMIVLKNGIIIDYYVLDKYFDNEIVTTILSCFA